MSVNRGHIGRIFGTSQAIHVVLSIRRWQTSVMSRCRSLGVMINTCLGIYVPIRKHTAGPPVDTVVEILSPVNHFYSSGVNRHLLAIAVL
ncbi:hypothetical protein ACTXT7_006831 [Hymenolepis weldensis]